MTPAPQRPVRPSVRIALQTLGLLSLGLGFAGAFLPLLPTTPFILLSAWCFAKSSPKWHAYIHNHREFGPLIGNWKNHRSISKRHKILAAAMISISITAILLSDRSPLLKSGLSTGLAILLVFLLLTKTSRPNPPEPG